MVEVTGEISTAGTYGHLSADWPRLYQRAARVLLRRLRQEGALGPREVAKTVAGALPSGLGSRLLRVLDELGWLRPAAQVPFDVLDSLECPAALRGPGREIARLAVFGLPGEGRPDFKHRDAAYQQLCAEIVREANDLTGLSGAATRALSHPDVCQDPVLAGMVRSFISQREAELRTKHRVEHPEPEDDSQLVKPFEHLRAAGFPTRHQIRATFARHQREFEVHLAQYNEAAARYSLEKMQDLVRRFPVHLDPAVVRRHQQQFEEFLARCATFREQIDEVVKQAVGAAQSGDQKTATWLIRRLRAIHALTPVLLSAQRFEVLREQIEQSLEQREHQEALQGLIAREREVAAEIKKAGAAIYRFHKVARTTSPETEEYKRAEAAYRAAVDQVRLRDMEWLTGLLLELETYLEDLHDPVGQAQERLDRFIGTVRSALTSFRREIRAIQAERARGGEAAGSSAPGSPAGGDAPAPPS